MGGGRVIALCGLVLLGHACTAAPPAARQYALEGQILAIRPDDGQVLIQHSDIKGFMPAMTMPFKVSNRQLLDGLVAGDLVRASLEVANTEAWLTSLEKTGAAPLNEPAPIPPGPLATPVQTGDPVPNTTLTDQDGSALTLQEWRGSAIAITFIYIRCPLPQFCPLLDRRFGELQRGIADDPKLATRARLLSVSFDPDADTAERLRIHAARLNADPAIWRFATASRDEVDRFAARFGVTVIREPDRTITHSMRTAVVAPDGTIARIYSGSEWTTAQILDDLRRVLGE
jgi:protein SCO1/2